jgi:hypothetical protein
MSSIHTIACICTAGAEASVASDFGRRDIQLMSKDFPLHKLPPGSQKGDFVALEAMEFQKGYATLLHGLAGLLPRDPDFPTGYHDAITGKLQPLEDTPKTRAIYAAGKLFTDDARRISFLWRSRTSCRSRIVPSTPSGATTRARPWTLPCWKRWQPCPATLA